MKGFILGIALGLVGAVSVLYSMTSPHSRQVLSEDVFIRYPVMRNWVDPTPPSLLSISGARSVYLGTLALAQRVSQVGLFLMAPESNSTTPRLMLFYNLPVGTWFEVDLRRKTVSDSQPLHLRLRAQSLHRILTFFRLPSLLAGNYLVRVCLAQQQESLTARVLSGLKERSSSGDCTQLTTRLENPLPPDEQRQVLGWVPVPSGSGSL
jgi:hypothetical protein